MNDWFNKLMHWLIPDLIDPNKPLCNCREKTSEGLYCVCINNVHQENNTCSDCSEGNHMYIKENT